MQKALTAVKSAMRLRRLSSFGGFAAGRALLAKESKEDKDSEEKKAESTEETKKVEGNMDDLLDANVDGDANLVAGCGCDVHGNDNQMHVISDTDCDVVDRVQCITNKHACTHIETNERLCERLGPKELHDIPEEFVSLQCQRSKVKEPETLEYYNGEKDYSDTSLIDSSSPPPRHIKCQCTTGAK